MTPSNVITLPQEILDRVERVLDYHNSTKLTPAGVAAEPHAPDPSLQPYEFRVFEMIPALPLPQGLLDPAAPTLALMEKGFEAVPNGAIEPPPQDLKTLASWLHFANGIAGKKRTVTATEFTRTIASDGNVFPCELYVAAFAVDGLEPGLYHYAPREFALRKLRDAGETLARLTRGRPDLMFLRTAPLAMLVSTIFCRSTWKFAKRGYRNALHDAGYLVQNLVTVGTGLGAQTMARLTLNDAATRELIGVPADAEFADAEAVQAMVAWTDPAAKPLVTRAAPPAAGPPQPMPPIERSPLAYEVTSYVSIPATQQDCVAPGVAVREVRPPLTDLSPLSPSHPTMDALLPMADDAPAGAPLRKVLLTRQASTHFAAARPLSRAQFTQINRLAFRSGTFYPLHPDGSHVALVRPIWLVHDVTGMDAGIWYYHPPTDAWSFLRHGHFRKEAAHLASDQPLFGHHAAATCFLVANLHYLMSVTGPDIYRLAHLESGIVTNRIALATEGLDLGWAETGSFFDDDARQFLGLGQTGWEILNVLAIGNRPPESQ